MMDMQQEPAPPPIDDDIKAEDPGQKRWRGIFTIKITQFRHNIISIIA